MQQNPRISFEFFPPKTDALLESLWQVAKALAPLNPAFVSVTYGAGGSTRDRTHALVTRLQDELKLKAAAHLTCVGATREEINAIAAHYWRAGIMHLVALRGDAPDMKQGYVPHAGGYPYARDLVEGLKHVAPFEISVAAYPETHPEAKSATDDLDHLKRKIDAGAIRAITQFFFDNDVFLRFRDRAAQAGIKAPIVPGLLPIANFERAIDFAQRCGAAIPASLGRRFEGLNAASDAYKNTAIAFAIEQAQGLQREGVSDFHFYTLNRADLVIPVCAALSPSHF